MPDEIGSWALYDRLPYDSWVFEGGKVVLIGDAAHVLTTCSRLLISADVAVQRTRGLTVY